MSPKKNSKSSSKKEVHEECCKSCDSGFTVGAIVAGLILVALLALSIQMSNDISDIKQALGTGGTVKDAAPQPTQQGNAGQGDLPTVEVSADDDPAIGDEDAPIVMIEFSDFQCPFCKRFYDQTLPQIKSQYVDTGKVKLVYRDFPLSVHPMAQKSAEAAECADEQGEFWGYHDVIFERQGQLSVDNLKAWADELGLDTRQFNQCLDSGKYAEEVQEDFREGQAAGVSGTPSFFINGKKLVGAHPFSTFKQVLDAELS